MMTRFEEVIVKTAAALQLPYDVVFDHIMDIALRTQNQLENPKTMEIDLFGIGSLGITYAKALRKQVELKNRVAYARRHQAAQTLKPHTVAKKVERIEEFEEVLASLDAIVEMKGTIKDSGGRQALYNRERGGDLFEREPYFPKFMVGDKPLRKRPKPPMKAGPEGKFTKKKRVCPPSFMNRKKPR